MADVLETLTHPVLGTLTWERHDQWEYWSCHHELADGFEIVVTIEPGDHDRHAFLKRAADLFLWAMKHERTVFRHAADEYLLGLYNDGWRQGGDPDLDDDEFAAALGWEGLTISDSEFAMLEFWYHDGESDLFGGHVVVIELDDGLKHRSAHLEG